MLNLGWVDFSKSDRDMVLNVLRQLTEPGAIDELGIGTIRDGFANILFPGTSTIQTRAKYHFIIPYICLELERGKKLLPREFINALEQNELDLIDVLAVNGAEGVIGQRSRQTLIRKGFDWWADEMTRRVDACGDEYILPLTEEVRALLTDDLIGAVISGQYDSIAALRLIFAKISIRRLDPDLVIMDEFQRFRELITAAPDSETGMLTGAFLKDSGANTLLLSATPYKLYQTLEEAVESGVDEHYQEFLELMRFLFSDDDRSTQFEETWSDFSNSLREVTTEFGTLLSIKGKAEQEMYSGMCRTERLLVDGSESFIDAGKNDNF